MDQEVLRTLAYGLTVVVAVCVGILYSYTARLSQRKIPLAALGLIVFAFVILAFAMGSQATWMGPIFALIVVISSSLTRGALLRDHPLIGGESYWRRVLWGTFRAHYVVETETEPRTTTSVQ